jgi:hypothetical protein
MRVSVILGGHATNDAPAISLAPNQARIVGMFQCFIGLCVFAFEVSKRHVQRLVTEAIWLGAESGSTSGWPTIHQAGSPFAIH